MGKLYTIMATIIGIKEIVDAINRTVLHADATDPQNLFRNYMSLDEDVKDIIQLMSCWIGMAQFYFGFVFLATAQSNEPSVRALSSLGCSITCYLAFVGFIPAAQKMTPHLTTDVGSLITVAQGFILGPLFGFAAFREYQEAKRKRKKH